MSTEIPKKMKALFLTKFVEDFEAKDLSDHFEVKEIDVPEVPSGHVLIKVEVAPINPSDLSTFNGTYNAAAREELPAQLGYEGSGTVVGTGGGLLAWLVKGKRVGFVVKGGGRSYAEYAVVPATQVVALPDDVTFEEGCSCFVNPLTAVSFIEIAKARGVKTIVHTAAASALGKMLVKYGLANGVDVICVVRRESQEKSLRDIGAKFVVNSSEEDWKKKLAELCETNKATLGFDAVAGGLTGDVLKAMPKKSELQVYGGLSKQAVSNVTPTDLIFLQKKLTGFWLVPYLGTKSLWGKRNMTVEVAANLKQSLGSDVRVSYSYDKAAEAITDYITHMSEGKVVFKPSDLSNANEEAQP